MALVNKKITPEELAQKLANSRKVMQKVDTGDYQTGNINEQALVSDDIPVPVDGELPIEAQRPTNFKSMGPVDANKINQSRLPDAIKQAMIEHPIPQITLNDGLDIDFINRAKQIMVNEGVSTKSPTKSSMSQKQTRDNVSSQIDERKLEKLIENIVRKVMDEKLNQILAAQQLQTINENLVLKVGDSIFQGKITKVKSLK